MSPRTFSWLEPRKTQIFKGGFPYDFSEVVLGIGSVLPLLEAARSFRGILLETPGCPVGFRLLRRGSLRNRVQLAFQVDQAGRGELLL